MSVDQKALAAKGVPESIISAMMKMDEATALVLAQLHGAHDAPNGQLEPIEIDDEGVMHGKGVTYVPSVRHQALATPTKAIEGFVAHWTDTTRCGAVNLAKRIAGPVDAAHARSCHAWIGEDGAIAQSVPFTRGSWHAGSYTATQFRRNNLGVWIPQKAGTGGYGANSWTAGIEHENVGEVRHVDGKWIGWPFKFGGEAPAIVDASDVVVDAGNPLRGHQRFTTAAINATTRVYLSVIRRYNLIRENCGWGHCDIDPDNRTDPGPLFMGKGRTFTGGILSTILDQAFGPLAVT